MSPTSRHVRWLEMSCVIINLHSSTIGMNPDDQVQLQVMTGSDCLISSKIYILLSEDLRENLKIASNSIAFISTRAAKGQVQ